MRPGWVLGRQNGVCSVWGCCMQAELTPEAVFVLAVLKARLRRQGRKKRERLLRELAKVLAEWEDLPTPIRRPNEERAIATAAQLFRDGLPKLLA